jgi:hypothetical protein
MSRAPWDRLTASSVSKQEPVRFNSVLSAIQLVLSAPSRCHHLTLRRSALSHVVQLVVETQGFLAHFLKSIR